MVDQGNGAEIMYLDLFKGLGFRLKDLDRCNALLIRFDGNTTILKGMIQLLVQTGEKVVDVNFIVMDTFSPDTAILVRPCLHAMGAVSSTLHVNVKYPTSKGVVELLGCQSVARQCMVAAIGHHVAEIDSKKVAPTL